LVLLREVSISLNKYEIMRLIQNIKIACLTILLATTTCISQNKSDDAKSLLLLKEFIIENQVDSALIMVGEISNINAFINCNNFSYTPLGLACKYNRSEIVNQILNKDSVNVNLGYTDDFYEFNTLDLVIENRNNELFKLLLKRGVDYKEIFDEYGNNALSSAVKHKQYEMVELLLLKGLPVNGEGNLGSDYSIIPLLIAVENQDVKMVELLIENGADANLKNNQGYSPLSVARSLGLNNILAVLTK